MIKTSQPGTSPSGMMTGMQMKQHQSGKPYRVLLDARRHANSGVGRVCQWLVRHLSQGMAGGVQCVLLLGRHSRDRLWLPADCLAEVECITTDIAPFTDAEYVELPRLVASLGVDVFLNPQTTWSPLHTTPSINVVHDLWALVNPQWLPSARDIQARFASVGATFQHALADWLDEARAASLLTAQGWQDWQRVQRHGDVVQRAAWAQYAAILAQSAQVVVVSPHLMAQVDARFAPLAPRTVLTNCPQPLPCTGLQQARHWLCLAKIEPRKNLHHLLDGYALYARTVPAGQQPLPLIMAGDDGYTAHAEELHGSIQAMQAQGLAVSFQPSVSDAVLADLFAHAAALVSPSLFEGFGFPPLEAMLQLVPVIAVPTGMLQGPLGAHVLPISGHDPQQLAQALHTVASQPPDSARRQQAREAVLRCFDAQAHAQAWTDLIRSTAERVRGLTQIKGCGLI